MSAGVLRAMLEKEKNEFRKFASLVKRMREAQEIANRAMVESDDYSEALIYVDKANELEKEVDEYLKKIND